MSEVEVTTKLTPPAEGIVMKDGTCISDAYLRQMRDILGSHLALGTHGKEQFDKIIRDYLWFYRTAQGPAKTLVEVERARIQAAEASNKAAQAEKENAILRERMEGMNKELESINAKAKDIGGKTADELLERTIEGISDRLRNERLKSKLNYIEGKFEEVLGELDRVIAVRNALFLLKDGSPKHAIPEKLEKALKDLEAAAYD